MTIWEVIDKKVVRLEAYYCDLLGRYVTTYKNRTFYIKYPSRSKKELLDSLERRKETAIQTIKTNRHLLKVLTEQIKICKLSCRSRPLKSRSRA